MYWPFIVILVCVAVVVVGAFTSTWISVAGLVALVAAVIVFRFVQDLFKPWL